MNRKILPIFAVFAAVLCSCGDSTLVGDNDTPKIAQYVSVATSNAEFLYDDNDSIFVELGETIKFNIGISVGGNANILDSLNNFYSSVLWNIDGDMYNIGKFRYAFQTPGQKKGYLETVDHFGDTLRNHFEIFVNTPSKISLAFPYDGYNQAEPLNKEGFPLRWNNTGIDPWETSRCFIFINESIDSLWNSPLGSLSCENSVTLRGEFTEDSAATFYWAIAQIVQSPSGKIYTDTSEVFHFSTKLLDGDSSVINIPLVLEDYRLINSNIFTKITLVNVYGDTIKVLENASSSTTISTRVAPQTGLQVYFDETLRSEYRHEPITVDIPSRSVIDLDTVRLTDRIAPQTSVTGIDFLIENGITFYVYDDGAGTGISRLNVLLDNDTLLFSYISPVLTVFPKCEYSCKLKITGSDYAKNEMPNQYWVITNNEGHYFINGPLSGEAP